MVDRQINQIVDLARYPLADLSSPAAAELVARCRAELGRSGMFNLTGFLQPGVDEAAAAEVAPLFTTAAFMHARDHNIYFSDAVPGLEPDHPALAKKRTVNRTLCADQIAGSIVLALYRWPPLGAFLAATLGKPALYPMADPLAGANVMAYRAGEALNWHFDRSEFTTTLLLQAPDEGGDFEYRTDLRSDDDPNYDGVARLLADGDADKRRLRLTAGTLTVFRGKNTAHRVTPVEGDRDRIIAVFSYYERPGVRFSAEERIGFYGRAA